ncbi:MAG TPA: FxLYD domain-containing protein [Thermoanaerobaculia bacterium]|nr:FxLYD domain-containing protein [Thermoanaerobaculia bacterium]
MNKSIVAGGWVLGAALLASCTAAKADWLVLRDGSRIEAKGPWKVSGKQIVFTTVEGKLSSLRGDLVDLDASARATEEALRERKTGEAKTEPTAPEAKAKSRWSFTDKDFARPQAEEPSQDDDGDKKGAKAKPPEERQDLEVVVWSQSVDPARNRVKVSGTLQNGSKDMAASVELEVQLIDRQGVVVGAQPAVVQKLSLAPGESTDFSTTFPQIVSYQTVKFAPKASMFKVTPKEDEDQGDGSATP